MPLRTIMLSDGTVCTRMIRSFHPDGTEFFPEGFAIPDDTPEGKRIYETYGRMLNNAIDKAIAQGKTPQDFI